MTPGPRGWSVLFCAGLLAFAFYASGTGAQHLGHPPEEMEIHERFYSNWMMPDNPTISCCHKQDCHPAQSRFIDGHWEARWTDDDMWMAIPPYKVEQSRDSPDGRAHMCGRRVGNGVTVYCFVRGGGV